MSGDRPVRRPADARWAMGWMRGLGAGLLGRLASTLLAGGTHADPTRLRRRLRIDRDWQEPVDDAAPRLDSSTTISVTRVGRFRHTDPLRTAEGWRNPRKVLAVTIWAAWVGGAAALGWWRRRGPLAALRRDDEVDPGDAGDALDVRDG